MRSLSGIAVAALMLLAGCGPSTGAPTAASGETSGPGATSGSGATAAPTTAGVATAGPGGGLPDPCSLVTQEEAAIAVAAPVGAGVTENVGRPEFGSGTTCSFVATDGEGVAMIGVFPNPGDEIWQVFKAGQGPVPALPGAGDDAFTVGNGVCVVLKGDALMELTLTPGDGFATDPEPRMKDLCLAASARL